jgi:hypothetical protein
MPQSTAQTTRKNLGFTRHYLDGKLELKGGAKADLPAAYEWIPIFLNDAVVKEPLASNSGVL